MTRIAPANGEVRSPMPPCGGMRAAAARFAPLIATLCFAVVVCPKVVGGPPDPHMVQSTLAGTQLTADDAEALEERLRGNPHDATARLQLIGYHSFRQWTDSTSVQRHGQLVLWMIRNDPRSPLLAMPYGHIDPLRASEMYERAKESWLEHLEREPDDAVLLGHAAALLGNPTSLFERVADRDLAVSLLERAQEADPGNAEWPFKLGHMHWLGGSRSMAGPDETTAAKALSHFERAYRLGGGAYGPLALISVMRAAFAAGRVADARAYAVEAMASEDPLHRDGDTRHRANILLGRIALAEGDLEEAGKYLLAAGQRQGSPSLSTFGPNMRLAQELLERGERDVVLAYFELCRAFWKEDRLDQWAALVRAGSMPDFGGNLLY